MAKRKRKVKNDPEDFYFTVDDWHRDYTLGINDFPQDLIPGHFYYDDCIVVEGRLRQGVCPVNHRFALSRPALVSALSKKSFSRVSSPIFACSTLMSMGGDSARPELSNTTLIRSSSCVFHCVIWLGCTSNCCDSSEIVLPPFTAANATFDLNTGE